MNELIAHCGLDCEKCDARIATINNDDVLRQRVAKKWSELNGVEITPQMINCMGCRANGVKTPFCASLCPIKKCAVEKHCETCASCNQMQSCKTLKMITGTNKEALERLLGNQ